MTQTIKILVHTFVSQSEAVMCEAALVTVDLDALARRRDLARTVKATDSALYGIEFWDHSAVFFEGYFDPDEYLNPEQVEKYERDQFLVVPDDFELPGRQWDGAYQKNPMRTECDMINVSDDTVYWSSFVKHTDVRVETYSIPLNALL